MATWQLLLAAAIAVIFAVLTNYLSTVLGRPSPRTALWVAVAAFALSALGLWITDDSLGNGCTVRGVEGLEPARTTVALGGAKTFAVTLKQNQPTDLVYDWSARLGQTTPGQNSNSPRSLYRAPDLPGEDTLIVRIHLPGCGEKDTVTLTAAVAVVNAVTPPSDTPTATLTQPAPAGPSLTPTPQPTDTPPALTPSATSTPIPSLLPTPAPGTESTREKDAVVMVFVPAGTFTMGSTDADPDAYSDEKPAHDVTLDAFWMDKFEVTNFQYAQCVNGGDCESSALAADTDYNGQTQPVVGVTWQDAYNYCQWAGARLPTEAEWEYAARGLENWLYPWGDQAPSCQLANFSDCVGRPADVGSYSEGASWVGALDMAGNVWEWVNDWHLNTYYKTSLDANPLGPDTGTWRVVRGGSWDNNWNNLRAANRNGTTPTGSYYSVGFRCASAPGS